MLKCLNLSYAYSGSETIHFPDFEVANGQAICLLGSSGKGKSTLLHLLSGLLPIQGGEIHLNQFSFKSLSSKELNNLRKSAISVILQETQFVEALTFQENIALALGSSSNPSGMEFASSLASDLGVEHLLHKRPKWFSGGEKQRAALVVAMAKRPTLLLADEPTANLDDDNAEKVANVFLKCSDQYGVGLVVVTHDARLKKHFKHTVLL